MRILCLFLTLALAGLATAGNAADRQPLADTRNKQDTIIPRVGTLQFIQGFAYSIRLDRADDTARGLHLKGSIGNATDFYVQNLALKLTAGEPFIGSAVTRPIHSLAPDTREAFDVTIPNVRQTRGLRIAVAFSGERYFFPP